MKHNMKIKILFIGLMVLIISIIALWLYPEKVKYDKNPINQLRVIINPIYDQLKRCIDIEDVTYATIIDDIKKTDRITVTIINLKGHVIATNQKNIDIYESIFLENQLYMDQSYTRQNEGKYKLSLPIYNKAVVNGFAMFELDKSLVIDLQDNNKYATKKTFMISISVFILVLLVMMAKLIFRKEEDEFKIFRKGLINLSKGVMEAIDIDLHSEHRDLYVMYNIVVDELSYMIKKQSEYENKRKEFLTMISHELKTPIATINAYIEGLLNGLAKDDETRERYQNVIYNKMKQLSKQIEELFKYAQEESGQFKYEFSECYADEVFGRIFTSLAGQSKIEVEVVNLIPKCIISVDKTRIEQVIMNIFNNAVKHSQSDENIKLNGYRQDHEIIIEISDCGNGISPKDIPYIFDYYYQGSHSVGNDYEGIGLGLAICKDIIDKHNGVIKVKSIVGEGSTFSIIIPLV